MNQIGRIHRASSQRTPAPRKAKSIKFLPTRSLLVTRRPGPLVCRRFAHRSVRKRKDVEPDQSPSSGVTGGVVESLGSYTFQDESVLQTETTRCVVGCDSQRSGNSPHVCRWLGPCLYKGGGHIVFGMICQNPPRLSPPPRGPHDIRRIGRPDCEAGTTRTGTVVEHSTR
jgi:hypothetical protein